MASTTHKDTNGTRQSHIHYANELLESGLFSDCTIRSGHRTWSLHRAILAQRCEFFRACFSNQFREATIASVGAKAEVVLFDDQSDAVERMLRWIYTLEYPVLEAAASSEVPFEGLKSSSACVLPDGFWTSELALFTVADKYGLPQLAQLASSSMGDAVVSCRWNVNLKLDSDVQRNSFSDYTDMLETLYVELPSTSNTIKQLRQALLQRSAMIIAAQINQQSRLSDLVADLPELATDLVEALRQTVEVCSDLGMSCKLDGDMTSKPKTTRSSSSSSSWAGYRSGSESDASGQSPGSTSSRRHVYIPMNEDSDYED